MPWFVLEHETSCGADVKCRIPAGEPLWQHRAVKTIRRCAFHALEPMDVDQVEAALEQIKRRHAALELLAAKQPSIFGQAVE